MALQHSIQCGGYRCKARGVNENLNCTQKLLQYLHIALTAMALMHSGISWGKNVMSSGVRCVAGNKQYLTAELCVCILDRNIKTSEVTSEKACKKCVCCWFIAEHRI